ncbi:MAG: glycoside hydrolase family 15 protein [Symbiobacteriia bacterium]
MTQFELRAKPLLIDAVTGNGHLLLTLGRTAEPYRLFWPHIDYGQHLDRWLEGIWLPGRTERTVWQDSPGWQHVQRYDGETNLVVTESAHAGLGLAITRTDAVVPRGALLPGTADLWLRRIVVANRGPAPAPVTFVLFQSPRFEESPLYNTSLFDGDLDALVHYRRQVYLTTGADRAARGFTCGLQGSAWAEAAAGTLGGSSIQHGDTEGALTFDLGVLMPGEAATLNLYTALAEDMQAARQLLTAAREAGSNRLLALAGAADAAWLRQAEVLRGPAAAPAAGPAVMSAAVPAPVLAAYNRSLLVMKLMTDAATGALIAAPEFDPAYEHSGGYAYCWGRDAAYITVAIDRAGLHANARAFYRWAVRSQEQAGLWVHRHTTEGVWGASWGLVQIDETGSLLFGMAEHLRLTGDAAFAAEVYDAVQRAAEYLLTQRHPETGLAGPSVDLWEERTGYLTYSTAAAAAGLRGAAELAEAAGHADDMRRWRAAAADLAEALQAAGWDEKHGAFLRMRHRFLGQADFLRLQQAGDEVSEEAGPKGYSRYLQDREPVLDASLLGLAVPFGVIPPGDPAMEATVRRLEEALTAPGVGGLRRYQGDTYRGGNPWVLCTLWLGQYEEAAGRRGRALAILDWALARQTPLGLLPEQVDASTGEAAWVVPLTWSHAMLVLLVQQLAAAGAWN